MKRVLNLVIIAVLALAGSAIARAQQKPDEKPADKMPTIDEILDKHVKAIGGKAAIEKINTRIAKGTFDIPTMGMSGSAEMFAKAPNKSGFVVDLPGFGTVKQVYNGGSGWAQDPMSGLRDLSPGELAGAKVDEDFYRDIRLKELYPKMQLKGKVKVSDRDAYLIEATSESGSTDKLYFDVETGLLVRTDGERETPQGKMLGETYLEDYKEVDGIKIPFTLRINNPVISFTIKLTQVQHNVAVDEARFAKPAAQ